tara:strand:+ start:276 stop:758 length:483 start_codon:yes stop_codon:yes gene_type:complete
MQTILITNYHPAGFAFALTEENEQVFIPPYATDGAQLERGKHYQAVLIPNHKEQERDRTPYMAVSVLATEPATSATPATTATSANQNERDEAVYKLICGNSYMTTREIAECSDLDPKTASNSANRLFNAGRIAKAEVYNRVGQSRSSFVLWAENANEFEE